MAELAGDRILVDEHGTITPAEARKLAARLYRFAKLAERGQSIRPTQAELRHQLHYDPITGEFTWLVKSGRNIIIGQRAGTQQATGYILIRVNGENYSAHRLAWLFVTGEWPALQVDHKNRKRADNRWGNLRLATRRENLFNTCVRSDNQVGLKGVYRLAGGRYAAQFCKRYLGSFDTPELAHAAYVATAKGHTEFAHDGAN